MIKGLFAFSIVKRCLCLSFLFLQSFPLFSDERIQPTWSDIKYNPDYKGYVAENRYEKKEKIRDRNGMTYEQKKTLYAIFTVESGPHIGVQLFCNHTSGRNIAKDSPDSYIEPNGKKYYVYDYDKHLIYHNIDEEFIIILN